MTVQQAVVRLLVCIMQYPVCVVLLPSVQGAVIDDILQVFEALFECTLHMINKELEPFPEHQINFFKMLQAISTHCFPGKGGGG